MEGRGQGKKNGARKRRMGLCVEEGASGRRKGPRKGRKMEGKELEERGK